MSSLSGCKLTIVNPSHSETYPLNFDFSLFESVFHHILKGITLKGRLRHTVPTNVWKLVVPREVYVLDVPGEVCVLVVTKCFG